MFDERRYSVGCEPACHQRPPHGQPPAAVAGCSAKPSILMRSAVAGGIATGTGASGVVLLISNLAGGLNADPFAALFLILASLVLWATIAVSILRRK